MTNDICSACQDPSVVWFKECYKVPKSQLGICGTGISVSCSQMSVVTKVSERERGQKKDRNKSYR